MNILRRSVLNSAESIIVREAISKQYVDSLHVRKNCVVTLDSAFQSDIDKEHYEAILENDIELKDFFATDKKIVGITITPLSGNPLYQSDKNLKNRILDCFQKLVLRLEQDGYKVIFIPQLFGKSNDYDYMRQCAVGDNSYVMQPTYDCYFQQYIISKLYMVFGMRYHSNIFSAKMGTPFISISYEQKMKGFMEIVQLTDLSIDVKDLSIENLLIKYNLLVNNYDFYKEKLVSKHRMLSERSAQSTSIVINALNGE